MSCWLKKFTLIFSVVLVSGAFNSAPLLAQSAVWRVSNGDSHIYIAGILNFLPASAYPLPAEFSYAYQQSDMLIQAFPPTQLNAAQSHIDLLQVLRYPLGERLTQKLSLDMQQQLAAYFYRAGLDWQQFADYKPAWVMLNIIAREVQARQYTAKSVAIYFAEKAQQDGKPQYYLSSLQQQFLALATLGQGVEEALLASTLAQWVETETFCAVCAWQAADLAAFALHNEHSLQHIEPLLYQQLIVAPNLHALPKIKKMLTNTTVELVLLDIHLLAGKDGMLNLLQKAGYQVQTLMLNTD